MSSQETPGSNLSYAAQLRKEDPEKMQQLENMVRDFAKQVLLPDEELSDRSIMLAANGIANKYKRDLESGMSKEDLNKAIEDSFYEAVDVRLKTKKEGYEDKSFPK